MDLLPARHSGARGDPETMRDVNRTLVAEALWARGAMSRAELSRTTSISAPTVSAIVADLIAEGLLEETGTAHPGVGRPARLVGFSQKLVFVGCDLSMGARARFGLVRLSGELSDVEAHALPEGGSTLAHVTDLLTSYVDQIRHHPEGLRIGGVGVGVPGVCYADTGAVRVAAVLGWRDLELAPVLSAATGVPIRVDNDVNLALLGEVEQGAAMNAGNAVMVVLSDGIGGAVLVDGRLYRGGGGAGEIGLSAVGGPPQVHDPRRFGALEQRVFDLLAELVGRDVVEREGLGRRTGALARRLMDDDHQLRLPERARAELTSMIAWALAGAIGLLDPEVVVLGGWPTALGERLLDDLRAELSRLVPVVPPLRTAQLADTGVLIGAGLAAYRFSLGATRIQVPLG